PAGPGRACSLRKQSAPRRSLATCVGVETVRGNGFHTGCSGKPLIAHRVLGRLRDVSPPMRRNRRGSWTNLQGKHNSLSCQPQSLPGTFRAFSPHRFHRKPWREDMKIVVIGGTGLIRTKVVKRLRDKGHEVMAASPDSGVNTITGEGLAGALAGAQTLIDLANSPSFEDSAVLKFFETAGRNLLAAETAAGVQHHVALSIVGTDRLPDSGYLRAKMAQERLIKASTIPYTILRSTQFFEFMGRVADSFSDGKTVRVPPALVQPIASSDVVT